MSASDFKARCLALLDRVAETGERIVVTKHGKAVAMLAPLDADRKPQSLRGSVTYLTDQDEDLFSTGEHWEASGTQP